LRFRFFALRDSVIEVGSESTSFLRFFSFFLFLSGSVHGAVAKVNTSSFYGQAWHAPGSSTSNAVAFFFSLPSFPSTTVCAHNGIRVSPLQIKRETECTIYSTLSLFLPLLPLFFLSLSFGYDKVTYINASVIAFSVIRVFSVLLVLFFRGLKVLYVYSHCDHWQK